MCSHYFFTTCFFQKSHDNAKKPSPTNPPHLGHEVLHVMIKTTTWIIISKEWTHSSPGSDLFIHCHPQFFWIQNKSLEGFSCFFLKCTGCTEKKTYANMSIYNVSYWFLCVEYMILQAASHFGVGEGIAKKSVHETILKHLGGSITVGAGLISMSFGYDFFGGILWLNNNWLAVRHKMTFPFPAKDSSPGSTKIPQVGELPHVESGL